MTLPSKKKPKIDYYNPRFWRYLNSTWKSLDGRSED